MLLAVIALLGGLVLLVWSADRFVEGSAAAAKHVGISSLLIGMVIVGFGTSAPEMFVSAMAAMEQNSDLALGNAVGSNIVNTGLIIGITALISPIVVHSRIIRRELPLLLLITLISGIFFWDRDLSRFEATILLAGFIVLLGWSVYTAVHDQDDSLGTDMDKQLIPETMSFKKAVFWLVTGLVILIVSSRLLVWAAIKIAHALDVSDLIIGLTIVALGTSLPELAASLIAARKGEHDIAIGNVVGSNMFNLLAVVGIAGVISPMPHLSPNLINRDWSAMMAMTMILFVVAYGFRGNGSINRVEGSILLCSFAAYNIWLYMSALP